MFQHTYTHDSNEQEGTWVYYKADSFKQNYSLLVLRCLLEMCCIYLYSGIYWKKGREKGGKLWDVHLRPHKVFPRPSATSWPYKQCLLRSALLLEYEICMAHKEHMDHPSQYPLQRTIKKIIKPNTHSPARTHTSTHQMAHKHALPRRA